MSSNRLFGKLALGAALGVALTLTATQAWNVTAAPGDTDTTYVPVEPCRLFDTRPGATPTDGLKAPIAAGAANVRIQQVTGNVGRCVGIPPTPRRSSSTSPRSTPRRSRSSPPIRPTRQRCPSASNLNWVAGQAPTPNSVTVTLSPDGKIKFFNAVRHRRRHRRRRRLLHPEQPDRDRERASLGRSRTALGTNRPVVEYSSAHRRSAPAARDRVGPGLIVSPASEQLTVTIDAPSAGKVAVVANATAKQATERTAAWSARSPMTPTRRPSTQATRCSASPHRSPAPVPADPRHQPGVRRRCRTEHVRPDVRGDPPAAGHHSLPVDVGHVHTQADPIPQPRQPTGVSGPRARTPVGVVPPTGDSVGVTGVAPVGPSGRM